MRQTSLFDDPALALSGLLPALRAAMNGVVGQDEDGRKVLVDRLNALATRAGIKLTSGNTRTISKDTLDKWLSPADREHTPSILALAVVCVATGDAGPLRVLTRACGFDVITQEERVILEYAKADLDVVAARKRKETLKLRLQEALNER